MQIALFKYLSALILFGSNGVVASHIQAESLEIVFFRTTLGAISLLLLVSITSKPKSLFQVHHQMGKLALSGVFMGLGWLFLYKAYTLVGVGVASLLYYCGPILVILISILQKKEIYTHQILFGSLMMLVGMILIKPEGVLTGETGKGMLYGMLSAVMYACMVLTNRQVKQVPGLINSLWQLLASAVVVTLFLFLKKGIALPDVQDFWGYILILGIVNTALGCYLYFSSITQLPLRTVAMFGYLEPVSALVFATLFLDEPFGIPKLVGCTLILSAAIWTEQKQQPSSRNTLKKAS